MDNGYSFDIMNWGLPNTLVYEMAVTPDDRLIFAATEVGPYVYVASVHRWFDMDGLYSPDQLFWCVDYVPGIHTARFGTYGRGIWDFVVESVTVVSEVKTELPSAVSLSAYPNPFNASVTISFDLPNSADGDFKIFDSAGRLVAKLHDGKFNKGNNKFVWDGSSFGGGKLPSGYYLAILSLPGKTAHIKLTMVK
jgi:hypothetical protein